VEITNLSNQLLLVNIFNKNYDIKESENLAVKIKNK